MLLKIARKSLQILEFLNTKTVLAAQTSQKKVRIFWKGNKPSSTWLEIF